MSVFINEATTYLITYVKHFMMSYLLAALFCLHFAHHEGAQQVSNARARTHTPLGSIGRPVRAPGL